MIPTEEQLNIARLFFEESEGTAGVIGRILVAEVDRLRAQVAAVEAIQSRPVMWLETGIHGRGVSDIEIIWALRGINRD